MSFEKHDARGFRPASEVSVIQPSCRVCRVFIQNGLVPTLVSRGCSLLLGFRGDGCGVGVSGLGRASPHFERLFLDGYLPLHLSGHAKKCVTLDGVCTEQRPDWRGTHETIGKLPSLMQSCRRRTPS